MSSTKKQKAEHFDGGNGTKGVEKKRLKSLSKGKKFVSVKVRQIPRHDTAIRARRHGEKNGMEPASGLGSEVSSRKGNARFGEIAGKDAGLTFASARRRNLQASSQPSRGKPRPHCE